MKGGCGYRGAREGSGGEEEDGANANRRRNIGSLMQYERKDYGFPIC